MIMKLTIAFTSAFLLITSLAQAQESIKVAAQIKGATIYKNGATLSHKAAVTVPKGNHEIVIRNVANAIDPSSIQIKAPALMTIMSVNFTKDYQDEKKPTTIVLPSSELQNARRTLTQIINKRVAEEETLAMLSANQKIGGANTGVAVAELTKMATYYKTQQLASRDSIALYQEQEQLQLELITKLEKEAGVANQIVKEEGGYIVLQVMTTQAVTNELNISYLTPNAYWYPTYDFKIASTTQPLNIVYKANIGQTTGIDWKQTQLELATNNPSQNNTAPEVTPWFLAYGSRPKAKSETNWVGNGDRISSAQFAKRPITNVSQAIEGNAPGVQMTTPIGQPGSGSTIRFRGNASLSGSSEPLVVVDGALYAGNLDDINPKDIASMDILKDASATSLYGSRGANGVIVVTTQSRGMSEYTEMRESELNTTFDIAIPYDIASNGKEHTVMLKDIKHSASYYYFAAPRLEEAAFLMADLTNFEQLQLMPGDANLILDNTYIGTTWINPLLAKDTIGFSLGKDKKIIVERKTVLEKNNTKTFSGNKRQVFTYDIVVRNTKAEAVQLKLKEAYPIATQSTMEVELLESSKADVNKEKGLMSWDINLKPNETKTFRISYAVKYPISQVIGNL